MSRKGDTSIKIRPSFFIFQQRSFSFVSSAKITLNKHLSTPLGTSASERRESNNLHLRPIAGMPLVHLIYKLSNICDLSLEQGSVLAFRHSVTDAV